jgi:hypothetical protein
VSFEEEFFGPGNRLRWPAIQAGTLPADANARLGPFIEDLKRNPDVLVLPRVREDDASVEWYVLCSSLRFARAARSELRAFLGPTYAAIRDHATFDASDAVDAAARARGGTAVFKLSIRNPSLVAEARVRLRLLMNLRTERPVRFSRRTRATGRILRDFEYALIARDGEAALACIEELRGSGRLGATNALFMHVRVLAALEQWSALVAMPEFSSLLALARPRRVTEALVRAVYAIHLRTAETQGDPTAVLRVFRDEVLPKYRDLFRTRAGLVGYEVDFSFLLASLAVDPPDRRRAEAIAGEYEDGPRGSLIRALVSSVPAPTAQAVDPMREALDAFARAEVDRSFELALGLPTSFQRAVLLLRSAAEMGALSAATSALRAVDELETADRQRVEQTAGLAKLYVDLAEIATRPAEPGLSSADFAAPSSWVDWVGRLSGPAQWKAAVQVAEVGAREWIFEDLAGDASAVSVVADALLEDRPEWAQSALRDAFPFLVEFLLPGSPDPRTKRLLDALFLAVAMDEQVSVPQLRVLVRLAEARIDLGLSPDEYAEVVTQLQNAIEAIASPVAASEALGTLDMLVASPCAHVQARQAFVTYLVTLFNRWYRRIDVSQWALLSLLGGELDVPIPVPSQEDGEPERDSMWDRLARKRVALYSLREPVLRRVEEILRMLCPSVDVRTFADHVGGSNALRTAAATADVFVVATAAAKHAATIFIDANRPGGLSTLYARGQGSASMLDALRDHLK